VVSSTCLAATLIFPFTFIRSMTTLVPVLALPLMLLEFAFRSKSLTTVFTLMLMLRHVVHLPFVLFSTKLEVVLILITLEIPFSQLSLVGHAADCMIEYQKNHGTGYGHDQAVDIQARYTMHPK
jgi:hypothetical protein